MSDYQTTPGRPGCEDSLIMVLSQNSVRVQSGYMLKETIQ